MADLIKKIKIKKQDGTFTDYIPIGAEASNISTEDGLSVENKLNKKPYYFNTVADMKSATYLKINDMVITLGYYEINDGGGAEYKIVQSSDKYIENLNNNLKAELNIKKEINVKQLGAYGDGVHDDTNIIQSAIDYAYDNDIMNIFIPFGTFNITKPLYLYDKIALYGTNCNSSTIKKINNVKSTISNFVMDAICILINRDLTVASSNMVQNVKIHDIKLEGNISTYVADKTEENMQYAILGTVNIPKAQIYNFLISDVDVGIKARGCWTGWIKNCTWLRAAYRAIYFTAETQGLNIQNINTGYTHECGIEVHGASYSTLTDILVEWVYGGIAFHMENWHGDILNCGTEVGRGVQCGYYFVNSTARVTGGYVAGDTVSEELNNYMFILNNSTVEVENTILGLAVQEYKGGLAKIGNHSHLTLGVGTKIACTFRDEIDGSQGDDNSLTYMGRTYNVNASNSRSITSLTERHSMFMDREPYLDKNFSPNPKVRNINIYQDYINTPEKTVNASDASWAPPYSKGDWGLIYNSISNGKAAWICNRSNSLDTPETTGTISAVNISTSTTGDISMSSLKLENFSQTGMRLYKNATIKGLTSSAKAIINQIDYTNNKIYYTNLADGINFQVGEKIQLDKTTFVRSGDYFYIPIIQAGHTAERPTESVAAGTMFFDTVLGKPIWYTGSKWVDSTGMTV